MKQPPEFQNAQNEMRPGVIVRDGMLGDDDRNLLDIISADNETVHKLGLTHHQIAETLQALTETAAKSFGDEIKVDGKFLVRAEETRGVMRCPWHHPGVYPKITIYLKKIATGEELCWSGLSIHLIAEHSFYQGRGSAFRLDPLILKRILEL